MRGWMPSGACGATRAGWRRLGYGRLNAKARIASRPFRFPFPNGAPERFSIAHIKATVDTGSEAMASTGK